MASHNRWKEAQSFERKYWEKSADRIKSGQRSGLNFYKWRVENMMNMLTKAFPSQEFSFADSKVVEVGSGAVGMVSFLDARERYAIDPLCDFYATRPELVENRNPDVVYQAGKGEELPHDNESCDLVVIENVIDHVNEASGVMKEIHRILKPGAILYLTVNLHPAWGAFLHEIVAALRIDRGHPYTFTIPKIRKFLANHGFEIKYDEWESYRECRQKDLQSGRLKDKLTGISGLTEFLFTSVSLKV